MATKNKKTEENTQENEIFVEIEDGATAEPAIASPATSQRGPRTKVLVEMSLSKLVSEFGENGKVWISRKDYLAQHAKLRNNDLAKELGV